MIILLYNNNNKYYSCRLNKKRITGEGEGAPDINLTSEGNGGHVSFTTSQANNVLANKRGNNLRLIKVSDPIGQTSIL